MTAVQTPCLVPRGAVWVPVLLSRAAVGEGGLGKVQICEPSWPQGWRAAGRTVQRAGPGGVVLALPQVTDAVGPPGSGAQAGKFGSR